MVKAENSNRAMVGRLPREKEIDGGRMADGVRAQRSSVGVFRSPALSNLGNHHPIVS